MELGHFWLQEAQWYMQVIHSACWVYGNIDENSVKNYPSPGLVERRHHYIIGRLYTSLPLYIQVARRHKTSHLPGLEQVDDVHGKYGTPAIHLPVPLWSTDTGKEQALRREGGPQSLLRCGRSVMRQFFILQTAEQEQLT